MPPVSYFRLSRLQGLSFKGVDASIYPRPRLSRDVVQCSAGRPVLDASVVPFSGDSSNFPGLVYGSGVAAPQQLRAGTKLKLFSGTANPVGSHCCSNW